MEIFNSIGSLWLNIIQFQYKNMELRSKLNSRNTTSAIIIIDFILCYLLINIKTVRFIAKKNKNPF